MADYRLLMSNEDLSMNVIRKRCYRSRSPEKRREEIATKRLKGEKLTLNEKRSEEAEAVK